MGLINRKMKIQGIKNKEGINNKRMDCIKDSLVVESKYFNSVNQDEDCK